MAHDFGGDPTEVQAQEPDFGPAQTPRLPHAPTPPFVFKYHPLRWQYFDTPDGQGEWLPLLGTLDYSLGVSCIDKTGGDSLARVELDRRGWKLLPVNTTPDGRKYIRAFPCKGGLYHCSIWETPKHLGGRVMRPVIDEAGYKEWLRWLVREGHVTPPTEQAIELLTEVQQAKMQQVRAKAGKNPHRADEAKAEAEKTAKMPKARRVPVDPNEKPKTKGEK